ncbi:MULTISPECIES: acetyl-CoA carboxylase, carboxyltransferase subunit beta [Limosilactobacillus]|uniref:Acetyl-coenzyme A carboxylase carboxyl transferase subunit beta n=1 Tax=Limosilactobacillus reuteri TaxID=1598 RepID=A0AAX2STK9_LIMRT|nr:MULTISPECIES: acetyl-CoA carboxylase, carboxyltransferase subunit beta [Limosilactobacillus]MBB1110735.1 acetyl-CoA carboxylase, carboxyltransferase subunit beta [Limosilactobacillus balticus]RMX26247.1 acetyl-CoA carboxylase, carboxyltransferase subunit beta [Limosilactobacillus reuteri]TGB10637.1 acetyl-CoA carboxylase, carboxyltransferase subunit beta [Limosilactobacillus reuteri]
MQLYENTTLTTRHIQADLTASQRVPDGIVRKCPKCERIIFLSDIDKYFSCPSCDYGFRISARQRLAWVVDKFEETDKTLVTTNPLNFPNYIDKVKEMQKKTKLNDSILTGTAAIKDQSFECGIMDPTFIMGSLGTITGEKITRLFERATKNNLPVILWAASGGARMQEGIMSLMQMAKISQAVAAHSEKGLLYIVVLTDPTTGGVTASFAMQGDIILAEPHALVGFAGKRVIEQTIHEKVPKYLQDAENLVKHGFIDLIVSRSKEKRLLYQLLKYGK